MKTDTGWIQPDEMFAYERIKSCSIDNGYSISLLTTKDKDVEFTDYMVIVLDGNGVASANWFDSKIEAEFFYNYLVNNHKQALYG